MRVEPRIYLISAYHRRDYEQDEIGPAGGLREYIEEIGALGWETDTFSEPEELIEVAGRLCYRSFAPGLNLNVTKIREGNEAYIGNLLKSGHGSVLEHVNTTWILRNVSRVLTHELVRHRAGCAYSQESLRYVRLTEIPFWFPAWALEDEPLLKQCEFILGMLGEHQKWMAEHFGLDKEEATFQSKKLRTSFMRRFAPIGTATGIMLTANLRALRHIISMRTSEAAEEEIRLVFRKVAETAKQEWPHVFQDMKILDNGVCNFEYDKV